MICPILETKRLILRPLAHTDAPSIQRYFNNWNIIKQLSARAPWPYPDDGAETFIRDSLPKMAAGTHCFWVLTFRGGPNEAIGVLEFSPNEGSPDGDRGFWLAEPFWGQGLMTEAVSAMNDFVFGTLGIERYVVTNALENPASRRVKEKTGARFLDRFVSSVGHHFDGMSERWEVTRESWEAVKAKAPVLKN